MASFFIVFLVLLSYFSAAVPVSGAARASPTSIAAAMPRLDRFEVDAATSPCFLPPTVYNKHLSLLAQAIRVWETPLPSERFRDRLVEIANSSFPVPYDSDGEIPLERLDEIFTPLASTGYKTCRPSYSDNPGTPPIKDGMAAAYDEENITSAASHGVGSLLSASSALTLLYLFLVSAIIVNVYYLGCFRMNNALVLCLLLYAITIWVLMINDMLPTFSKYIW